MERLFFECLACRRHGTGAVRTAGQACGCKTSGLDIRGPIDVVAPGLDGMGTKCVAARPTACPLGPMARETS